MARITWHLILNRPALAKLWQRASSHDGAPRMTPEDVIAACDEFTGCFPWTEQAGGHVVIGDLNFTVSDIGWCLQRLAEESGSADDNTAAEVIHFLGCLLMLDDDERVAAPSVLPAVSTVGSPAVG